MKIFFTFIYLFLKKTTTTTTTIIITIIVLEHKLSPLYYLILKNMHNEVLLNINFIIIKLVAKANLSIPPNEVLFLFTQLSKYFISPFVVYIILLILYLFSFSISQSLFFSSFNISWLKTTNTCYEENYIWIKC